MCVCVRAIEREREAGGGGGGGGKPRLIVSPHPHFQVHAISFSSTVNIQIFGSYLISAIFGTDPKRLN